MLFFMGDMEGHWPMLLLLLVAVMAMLWGVNHFLSKWRGPKTTSPARTEKPTAKKSRNPGVWEPVPFTTPPPDPYPNWSLTDTKPLPYRPFRYGPQYFITMGLRKMDWNDWIELDNEFLSFHTQKSQRIIDRGQKCSHTAPDAYTAAMELLEELREYLPRRYPSLFARTEVGIDNLATGESFNILEVPLKEDPIQMAAKWVQDDLAIMLEGQDGKYYLRAGSILLPGFWRLEDKFGMSLDQIHMSGDVPGYQEKLQKGMNNFFSRIMPDAPVLRNNYFMQVDDSLPWSHSIGPEDGERFGWFTAQKDRPIEQIHFRSERQSLRRLPRSGGVVFTIRTYFIPAIEIAREPYVPGRLASAIRSWDDKVANYKGKEMYEKVLLEYLDEQHELQVQNGLGLEMEEEIRKYPW